METQRLLITSSGLSSQSVQQLVSVLSERAASVIGAEEGSLSSEEQKKLLQDMFRALSAADALPEYEMIPMPRMRVAVSQAVCECLLSVYRTVYASLGDGASAPDVKSPSQVATLLGVPEESFR